MAGRARAGGAAGERGAGRCGAPLRAAGAILLLGLAGCALGRARVENVGSLLDDSRSLLGEGRAVEAVEKLRAGLGRDLSLRDGWILLAAAYRAQRTIEARVEAEKILATLHLRAPDDTEILRDLAALHLEQGFFGKARREYRRVLALDPDDVLATNALGRLHEADWLRTFREDEYDAARAYYERSLELEPGNAEASLRLAFGEMEHGRTGPAMETALRFAATHPEALEAHLLLGALYARQDDFAAAAEEFEAARAPAGFLAAIDGIEFLVNEGTWVHYEDAAPWDQEAQRRDRWMESDPTPASETHERRVSHMARVFWSDLLYGVPRLGVRGWETAAGEMFIRYGPPVTKEYVPGSAGAGGLAPPRWVFTYLVEGEERVVVFEDLTLSGRFYFPMSLWPTEADHMREFHPNVLELPGRAGRIEYASRTWQFRGERGRTRVEYFLEAPEPPAPEGFHPRQWGALTREVAALDTMWRAAERRRENFARGWELRVGEAYRVVDGSSFQLEPGGYRLASEIEDLRSGAHGGKRDGVEVRRFSTTELELSAIVLGRAGAGAARGPDGADAAGAGDSGAQAGAPASQAAGLHGGAAAGAFGFAPSVTGRHPRAEPLEVYFEVYNLQPDLDGNCRWRGSYTLYPAGREKDFFNRAPRSLFGSAPKLPPHITQSFDEESKTADPKRRLRIDLAKLPPGEYQLLIEVTDFNSGRKTSGRTSFVLEAPRR